jgi:transposase
VSVVVDRLTRKVRIGVLCPSSFTFTRASWAQKLPDWIDAHVRALEVIGLLMRLERRICPHD